MSVNFSPMYIFFIITAAFAIFAWVARDSLNYFFRPKGEAKGEEAAEEEDPLP